MARDAVHPVSTSADASGRGAPRLVVRDLTVALGRSKVEVVSEASFTVDAGRVLGLVGESGSGKTTLALSLLGYTRRGLRVVNGAVRLAGQDVLGLGPRALRSLRGSAVSYVPQDPASALNPALRIGVQLGETLRAHDQTRKGAGGFEARIGEVLAETRLPNTPDFLSRYPHQLSGGQQQRVALAMAFVCRPSLIVLDEPTTGLDVTTQHHILGTIKGLCGAYDVAAVYVSHDLAVVRECADDVAVMYSGRIVEIGSRADIFGSPAHPYTKGLLRAAPSTERSEVLEGIEGQPPRPAQRPAGCSFAPRCPLAADACQAAPPPLLPVAVSRARHRARCIRLAESGNAFIPHRESAPAVQGQDGDALLAVDGLHARYGETEVLADVGLRVPGESCVAVVGESGSGKTTLARCIAGLHREWAGTMSFGNQPLSPNIRKRDCDTLQRVQYIFQNPYTSLNPRKTIAQIIEQPLVHFTNLSARERQRLVDAKLDEVALNSSFATHYPDQLSGGERQRVAIARALVVEPTLLICDEVTSALDVSIQASIVELLRRLQREQRLALLFITHNLALVRSIAQTVVVLAAGRVVEHGSTQAVLEHPEDPYTVQLLADMPGSGDLPAAVAD